MNRAPRILLLALACGLLDAAAVEALPGQRSGDTFQYAGTLRNNLGPLPGEHVFVFRFSNGTSSCSSIELTVTAGADGAFRVAVPMDGCPAGFFSGADINYDVMVDGEMLATAQPFGPVAYAKYADVAYRAPGTDGSNIARRTTGPLQLFVRTDGNDTECDGSADVAFSPMVAPACAVATPQQAVALLPEFIGHVATISVAAGTYFATQASVPFLSLSRPGEHIVIQGVGGPVVFDGALATAPGVGVTGIGIDIGSGARVSLQNLTLVRHIHGVYAQHARGVVLTNITVQSSRATGIVAVQSEVTATGALNILQNAGHGLLLYQSRMGVAASSTLEASDNVASGIIITDQSDFYANGTLLAAHRNGGYGLSCQIHSYCSFPGPVRLIGNNTVGLVASVHAFVGSGSEVTIQDSPHGIFVYNHSNMQLGGTSPHDISLVGRAAGVHAIHVIANSYMAMSGPGALTISNFTNAARVEANSMFVDSANHAPVAVAGASVVATNTTFVAGNLPRATCPPDSHCP